MRIDDWEWDPEPGPSNRLGCIGILGSLLLFWSVILVIAVHLLRS